MVTSVKFSEHLNQRVAFKNTDFFIIKSKWLETQLVGSAGWKYYNFSTNTDY